MRNKIFAHEAHEIAKANGLKSVEITWGMNGYPERLGDVAVMGFDNWEQLEAFIQEHGGEPQLLQSRDGWHFWEAKGRTWDPFTVDDYMGKLGDNYNIADTSPDYIKDAIRNVVDDFDGDFADLENLIADLKEVNEEVEKAGDNGTVITYEGRYYETMANTFMDYSHDTYNYAIGVLFRKDDNPAAKWIV